LKTIFEKKCKFEFFDKLNDKRRFIMFIYVIRFLSMLIDVKRCFTLFLKPTRIAKMLTNKAKYMN